MLHRMNAAATPASGLPPPPRPLEPAHLVDAFRDAVAAVGPAATPVEALDAVLDVLHAQLGGALVAAHVEEHGRLWLVGSRGYTMIPEGLPISAGIVGRATRTGRVQYIPDLAADPDYIEVTRGMASELAVPVSVDGEVVGVVNLETIAPLPRQTPKLVGPLAEALAPVLAAVRVTRTLDLPALSRLSVYVSSLRNPTEIVEIAAASLARVVPIETSQVCLRADNGLLEIAATRSTGEGGPEPLSLETIEALRARGAATAVIEQVDIASTGMSELAGSPVRSVVLIPLRANGIELGLLVGGSRWVRKLDRGQAEVASLFAAQVAASLDAAFALGRERRSALTDPLTGLLNRRGFEVELERALGAAHDDREPLSLWVLDFDDFKEVNDRAGHEFGDAMLCEVGHVLTRVLPPGACAGRIGGDEFVVMLPDSDADRAALVAQELRERLLDGLDEAGFPLRVSIGVATYPFDGGVGTQLLRAADQALYEAKAQGKNRVVGFRELVRDTARGAPLAPAARDRRGSALDVSALVEAGEAALAIWREHTVRGLLDRLCKSLTFSVGATGCNVSRVVGRRLVDVAAHALRDSVLAADTSYLIDEFPVTKAVLETLETGSVSFLDDDLDRSEAFVLRDLEMSCALLMPLVVDGRAWGLVELYDMRLRRYTREQQAIGEFLVGVAAHRLEALGDDLTGPGRLPLYRVPDSS